MAYALHELRMCEIITSYYFIPALRAFPYNFAPIAFEIRSLFENISLFKFF